MNPMPKNALTGLKQKSVVRFYPVAPKADGRYPLNILIFLEISQLYNVKARI
jgi:hypothetical protein